MSRIETMNPLHVTASSTKQVTTAAPHALDNTNFCPSCGLTMRRATVGRRAEPIEAWVCLSDRICLPIKD